MGIAVKRTIMFVVRKLFKLLNNFGNFINQNELWLVS